MATSGDNRSLKLDNVDYNAVGGSDFSRKSGYTKEPMVSSGKTTVKRTKQNEDIEGVEILVDGTERENILDLEAQQASFGIAYTTANGDSYTTNGEIAVTGDSTADGKMTISLIPTENWVAIVV